MSGTVLCVDPDKEARTATASVLEDAGLTVTACPDLAAAVDALTDGVDCVVSEFELPDGSGLDLLAAVRERVPDASFVLFTDAEPDEIDSSPLEGAVTEYVPKGGPRARAQLADLVQHSVTFRTQTAYPLPDDEHDRLAVLEAYRPVLTEAEASFDRLTTLLSDLLDVPMAAIGIVDEHEQEFVACYGVDFGIFPREDTVCTYALLEPGVTTINDLSEDPRFASNEGLDVHGLRAYASANLVTPEGCVVGTICAYDNVPREWTDEDREHLRLFAAEAMEVLELRRQLYDCRGDDADTDRRLDAVPAGGASDRDRDTSRSDASDEGPNGGAG
jgi:GAF domain-containing protein